MQLNRQLAIMGVKAGTFSGVVLAFLLSGTHVRVEVEIDTRDTVTKAGAQEPAETVVERPVELRFE